MTFKSRRMGMNIALVHSTNDKGPVSYVTVSYEQTTAEERYALDGHVTLPEALALVAVQMRVAGPPEVVMRARGFAADSGTPGDLVYGST